MLRSTANHIILDAIDFFKANHFYLPPFAYWTPADWKTRGEEAREIAACRLGWDVTDFGLNDFAHYGILLFTLRNGSPDFPSRKPYAEKVMIAEVGQEHQMHYHASKMEDIINRAGGLLKIRLFNATPDNDLDPGPVIVSRDGVQSIVPAGTVLTLRPGESITIPQRCFHKFWAEGERVMMGEVSMVNDDATDNFFYRRFGSGRFAQIVEDEPPVHLLGNEISNFWG